LGRGKMAVFRQKLPYDGAMTRWMNPLSGLQRLAALCGTLVAVACATTAPKPTPPVAPAVSIPVQPPKPVSGISKFDTFLEAARTTALAQGIRPEVFDIATRGLAPIPAITNANANQPEFSRPVWSYLDSAASPRRVKDGQIMLSRYGDVL